MRTPALCLLSSALLASFVVSAAEPPAAPEIKVMAFNVLFTGAQDGKSLRAIEAESPDVLCLRELSSTFATRFEAELGKTFPHRQLAPKKSGTWGVGVASKHPILRSEVFPETPHRLPAMEADLLVHGRSLRVVCLHLIPPMAKHRKSDDLLTTMRKNDDLRFNQAQAIVKRLRSWKEPVLVLGDLNEPREAAAVQALVKSGLSHACDTAKTRRCSPTFPGPVVTALPAVVEIDHILGRGLTFETAATLRAGGSDHYPVVATFRFTP